MQRGTPTAGKLWAPEKSNNCPGGLFSHILALEGPESCPWAIYETFLHLLLLYLCKHTSYIQDFAIYKSNF